MNFESYVDDTIRSVQKAYDRKNQKSRKLIEVDFHTRRIEPTRADKFRIVWNKYKKSIRLVLVTAVATWVVMVFLAGFVMLYL